MGSWERKLKRRGAQHQAGSSMLKKFVRLPLWQDARRSVDRSVRRGSVGTVPEAVTKIGAMADTDISRTLTRQTDCKRGCSYCCHVHVDLSIPELMRAVDFARKNFSSEQLDAIRQQAIKNAEAAKGTTPDTYPVQPCAFLSDGICSIYEARPLACRSEHSFDVGSCRRAYEENDNSPAERDVQTMFNVALMRAALDQGLQNAGYPSGSYELHEVLSIALSDQAAFERWAKGEAVFESGRTGPGMLAGITSPPKDWPLLGGL